MHNDFCIILDAIRIDLLTRVRIRLQKSLPTFIWNLFDTIVTILTIYFQNNAISLWFMNTRYRNQVIKRPIITSIVSLNTRYFTHDRKYNIMLFNCLLLMYIYASWSWKRGVAPVPVFTCDVTTKEFHFHLISAILIGLFLLFSEFWIKIEMILVNVLFAKWNAIIYVYYAKIGEKAIVVNQIIARYSRSDTEYISRTRNNAYVIPRFIWTHLPRNTFAFIYTRDLHLERQARV